MIISGAVQQSALGIESAHGRALTRTETERLSVSIGVAMRLVADRCAASEAKLPPPPPAARSRTQAGLFNPLLTQELPRVTPEALEAAIKARQK